MPDPEWHLYLVRTAAGALYTGVTTDVARRFSQHEKGRGARALRAKGPLTLAYSVTVGPRGDALRLEHAVKKLTATAKRALVAANPSLAALRSRCGLVASA